MCNKIMAFVNICGLGVWKPKVSSESVGWWLLSFRAMEGVLSLVRNAALGSLPVTEQWSRDVEWGQADNTNIFLLY